MSNLNVRIQWTETARKGLEKLPIAVRRGLVKKADALLQCDPRNQFKSLSGPLAGFHSIPYSRYRAIYGVDEERLPDNSIFITVYVRFIAVGIRKDGDKNDVYKFVEKLLRKGGVLDDEDDTAFSDELPSPPDS